MMTKLKIITDIRIMQSPIWGERTDFVGDMGTRLSQIFNKLSKSLQLKLKPFFDSFLIITNIKKYDVVITADIRAGQVVAFFRSLLSIRRPRQIILELMLDEEYYTFKGTIKKILQSFIFSSVDVIFVSSSSEVEHYTKRLSLPKNRIRFIHFHTNIIEPKRCLASGKFVLSAGRTGRDYLSLTQAVKGLPIKVVLVSDYQSVKGVRMPENIDLLINIPHVEYLDLVKKCCFVVVPLNKLVKSTGQVVVLEAMALGKPVIATYAVGTRDYIVSGVTGILVPPNDALSLRNAILELSNDEALQNTISENALYFIKANCTFDRYITNVLDTAQNIIQ